MSVGPIITVVTCEIKLFQNYSSLRRRPAEIILFRRVDGRMQLMNILQHVTEIILNYFFGTPSADEITLFQFQLWLHAK